jgi:hypothetical protein
MRKLWFLCFLVFFAGLSYAQTSPCSSTQYDMVHWVSAAPAIAADYYEVGNANLRFDYRQATRIISVKSISGFPWDIDPYDDKFIYQWITESSWVDPTQFKAFATSTTMPWMPRCIDIPSSPRKIASIVVPNPAYSFYGTGCVKQTTQYLGNTVNEVWGPYASIVDQFPVSGPYLELSYRYSCDQNYDNCIYKETFDFQKDFGLARWTLHIYDSASGQYYQSRQSLFNDLVASPRPSIKFPCPLP